MQRGAAKEDARMADGTSKAVTAAQTAKSPWDYPVSARGREAAARIGARILEYDYRACLAISDARKRDLAASRERAMNDPDLVASLIEDARRRGRTEIDWPEYFRNTYMM
jgi:hypothetical protein